uniref:Pol-like protein n=1 Tax=Takifugu rubripes TaxID=31033 RepID=Q76IM4_TAKRU|nr:pol-like protein [Takifugu rubripes]
MRGTGGGSGQARSFSATNCAGVGILFSPHFKTLSAETHHIMDGHVLMVKAVYENMKLVFLCVYAPVLSRDRMNCLNVLCNVVRGVQDEFLFMGGDFNCTVNARLDRNHLEPHPASSARLKRLLETYDLKDVWRGFNNATRQYTWAHCWDNSMSLARLDRLYCFKHHLSIFKNCHIVPVGVSDHSLLKCEFFIQNVKTSSAYWHFNTALLEDHAFRQALQVLWDAHRLRKPMFSSLHRWWDFGKTVTQQFCQQYTRNVTKHITRSLQDLETEVQNLLGCTENRGYVEVHPSIHPSILYRLSGGEVLQSKNAAIASLLGTTAQGALVCSRYMNASMMDAPSKFFFSLEQKNGQRKVIHCLRADDSSDITDTARIRRHGTCFYKELFKSYAVENPGLETEFLTDLSQVGESSNTLLSADLTLEELYVALMSLANGKAPGIDGIPVEFYKAFWSVVGKDMLEVFLESWRTGLLPRSCRRAIITLLPKKGDLQDLKNWRPVFLLCGDYKILSKALAIRLREAMAEVIHVDQTYCVPGRRICNNINLIRHVLDISSSLGIDIGLISFDREKAFDRVEHQYLWNTLAVFGFSPGFIARVQVMYRDVASILKINGGLAAPFTVQRGVRQGCSLSGMLYSPAIEPLLHKIRKTLMGVSFPGCPTAVKLMAYADDVVVIVNTQRDIQVLGETIELFKALSSAKVNWTKSVACATTRDFLGGWWCWVQTGGLKYLGVFLGNDESLKKNWEGVLEAVEGRLKRWKWLLPHMSYRGRTLVINNLVSSFLWHRLAVVDPPADLLSRVQTVIVDFLWDRLHWLPQVVLFLPKEEGGQGLVHLASKRAVFRLQFIQRLLYGPNDLVWRPLARLTLQRIKGLGLQESAFLMELKNVSMSSLPSFYQGLFRTWKLLWKQRANHQSSFWGETVSHGSLLSPPSWAGATVAEALCTAGVATLGALREATGPDLKETTELQVRLGWRSKRNVKRLLSHWRDCLTERERQLLREHSQRMTSPCPEHPFPSLVMRPGPDQQLEVTLETAESKALSRLMVRGLNRQRLERRSRSPWRAKLTLGEEVRPEWKSFYKPPLSKKAADLQWRLVYGVLAVNKFVSILSLSVTGTCPFCEAVETIVHCFAECPRLLPLFPLLEALFRRAGEAFSLRTFVYGFKYTKAKKDKCHLMNFILGQSKMAVYISRRRKVEDSVDCDVVLLLSRRIKARILIDFHFYRKMEDLEQFVRTWTYGGILCSIQLEDLVFSDQLV